MYCVHVVGARPNFMKAAPVIRGLNNKAMISQSLVHTGQHYDKNMSDIFFDQLGLKQPDINLGIGSASSTIQTCNIMLRFEEYITIKRPDLVFVYGDVNSTLAASLVCAKQMIPIAHVEAGLRSFDRTMPEEVNRVITDQISDLLFTPSKDGDRNLINEGIPKEKIYFVGNVMIDTLSTLLPVTDSYWTAISDKLKIDKKEYGLVTLHRPSNVEDETVLSDIVDSLDYMARKMKLVFPVHPRTLSSLNKFKLMDKLRTVGLIDPVGYLEFIALQRNAAMVITDSGGIQEETTWLDVPCLTIRNNTERPITIKKGTNHLVGLNKEMLYSVFNDIIGGKSRRGARPRFWDGRAGERIAEIIEQYALKIENNKN